MRTHRAAVQPCTVLRHTAEASYQWPAPCRQRMLVVRFATQSYGKLAQAQAIVRNSFAASPRPLVVLPLHGSGGARRLTEQVSSSSIREPPRCQYPERLLQWQFGLQDLPRKYRNIVFAEVLIPILSLFLGKASHGTASSCTRMSSSSSSAGGTGAAMRAVIRTFATLLSCDLWRSYWYRSVALFEENSMFLLPGSSEW